MVLYGLLSNIIIAIVLITIITKDPYGLVYFPENLYNYTKQLLFSSYAFIFSDIYKFVLPFLFLLSCFEIFDYSIKEISPFSSSVRRNLNQRSWKVQS